MSEGAGVRLAWVLHEGRPCHVSTFAGVPPQARPEVRCPLCQRVVVLRLGEQIAHHAAHQTGDACAVTAPESALHLNCKLHLAACLEAGQGAGAGGLRLQEPCAAHALRPVGCLGVVERPWLSSWAAVAVELSFGGRRPDITLLDARGGALAALEVHVQSPVSEAKQRDLARVGLPWAEVRGDPALLSWSLPAPLPAERSAPAPPLRCGPCALRRARPACAVQSPWQQTLQAFRDAHQTFAAAAAVLPAQGGLLLAVRPLDRYLPSAPRVERDALFIARRHAEPAAFLVGRYAPLQVLHSLPPSTADALPALQAWADAYLTRLWRVWIVDAPGGWVFPADLLADPVWRADWAAHGAPHRAIALRRLLGETGDPAVSADVLAYLVATRGASSGLRYTWLPPEGGWIARYSATPQST